MKPSQDMVLHGESSKRLAAPRTTKDKKHLQSTQSAQPTNLTDQAPRYGVITAARQQEQGPNKQATNWQTLTLTVEVTDDTPRQVNESPAVPCETRLLRTFTTH